MDIAGLRQLREQVTSKSFEYWAVEPDVLGRVRDAIRQSIDTLIAVGPGLTPAVAKDELRQCVARLNEIDDGFVGTIEREDLCTVLYQVGNACGIPEEDEWVDEYRDW